jgi:dTDP-4-dehydrorhamnose 3,5-epimerase
MRIINVGDLPIPDTKIITFSRFVDQRGYFSEVFKYSDFKNNNELSFLKKFNIVQSNESYSLKNVIRGLHIQWNPYQGKLVRTIFGRMIDYFIDLRIDSKYFGKAFMVDMPNDNNKKQSYWLWLPPGIAHGNFYTENSKIEYLCTGEYNPKGEFSINPLCEEIDYSLCDEKLLKLFVNLKNNSPILSNKDLYGYSLTEWLDLPESKLFKIKIR